MNFPDVDVDKRIPDPVSRMARLDEGLKDITVRLMHLDPPQEFTNGTRRERKLTEVDDTR
ncbi:hypothetical protein Hanom_Chr12g01100611 [Helianthus anomalus]